MESCLRYSLIVLLTGICSATFGETPAKPFPATSPAASPSTSLGAGETADANLPAMPFMAEITSNDVYVRSGAGTNYYFCSKLNTGDKIKVVGSKFSWLQIVPPANCYAWISSQYVQVNPQDKTVGTVIGDAVRVYAGADEVQPMHSTSSLVKLDKGDKVKLLGEEKEGYSKISLPEGAYLWVSSQFVKPLGSLMPTHPIQIPAMTPSAPPAPTAPFPTPTTPQPVNTTPVTSTGAPSTVSTTPAGVEDQRTKELDAIKAGIEAEKAKPLDEQNFSEMKKTLLALAGDKQSVRFARNAQNLLSIIERCELAREVAKSTKLQDEQFDKTTQTIENAKAANLSKLEDLSIFAVIGQLKESTVFAGTPEAKLYRIMDSGGKTMCYAQPTGEAAQEDLSRYIDKKVGLVGTIETSPEHSGAFVQFSKIIEVP